MRHLVPFLLCAIVACAPAPAADAGENFSAHWHDGRAELDGYQLEITRYGESRVGEAVMVYVTEPFSESLRVKLDDPSRTPSDAFDALKLNFVRDFQTGIYDYNTMISVFTRSDDFEPVKLSFSSAEWCGHVYDELVFRGDEISEHYFSYFEGESGSRKFANEPGGIIEDNLYILLRGLREPYLQPGEERRLPLLPSPFHSRLGHTRSGWEDATIARSASTSRTTVPAGGFETIEYTVATASRHGRFLVEADYPHRIVEWNWSVSAGGAGARPVGSERGRLAGSARLQYWNLNSNGDESYREKIGLGAPPR